MKHPGYSKEQLIDLARSFEDEASERENINPGRSSSFYAEAADLYEQAEMEADAARCRQKSSGMSALRNQIDLFGDSFSHFD
jgi:hypothetical protein